MHCDYALCLRYTANVKEGCVTIILPSILAFAVCRLPFQREEKCFHFHRKREYKLKRLHQVKAGWFRVMSCSCKALFREKTCNQSKLGKDN